MKHKLLDGQRTHAIICDDGEDAIKTLERFASERNLRSARFTAIGAFSEAELGYFDFRIKDYKKIPVHEQVEVLSLIGDIALFGDKPVIHAHVVLGRSDGIAIGGHLLAGAVHPTLEIILEEMPGHLQRRLDEHTGLPLIVID